MAKNKINIERFETACRGDPKTTDKGLRLSSRGQITRIAKRLGVHRHTVMKFIEKNKKAQIIHQEESEKPFDEAEDLIYAKMIIDRDLKAAEDVLFKHKKGRDRGWGEQVQQDINLTGDVKTGGKVEAEIIKVLKNEDEVKQEAEDKV